MVAILKSCAMIVAAVWMVSGLTGCADPGGDILEATGVKGGLVVHVGCGTGWLTASLPANDSYRVHGLDRDPVMVEYARRHIQALGLYGQVTVDRFDGRTLPYVDNLVNLVVVDNPDEVSMDEIMRVLCPDGVAYVKSGNRYTTHVKPRPEEIDEWTHYLHDPSNNAVAHDAAVGPPRQLQWVGSPRWARHHDRMASMSALVSSGGRLFYILDEGPTSSIILPSDWQLIARDAFNGTILWKRSIDTWHPRLYPYKSGPAYLPRRLVAAGDVVYATLSLNAPLTALDAATGAIIRTYEGTNATEEIIYSDGVLYLTIDESPRDFKDYKPVHENVMNERDRLMGVYNWEPAGRKVVAIDAASGETLWSAGYPPVPLTLAVDNQGVFFHDGERMCCLNRVTGEKVWQSAPVKKREPVPTNFLPTLVVYDDVVLFSACVGEITAVSARSGETLWTADHPRSGHYSPEDILVIDGVVWYGATEGMRDSGIFTGRDLHTGDIVSQFPPDVDIYWFHHRCYRAKATDTYLLPSRTGIEFIDFRKQHWETHHWVRGGCIYGIMPCNGLIYAPMHDCACYPEAKLYGFNALAPANANRRDLSTIPDYDRLEKGPAYREKIPYDAAGATEQWPTYRHDAARSGATSTPVPAELTRAWEEKIGNRLSSMVLAGNRIFVADITAHTLHAVDAASGETLWRYTAGGGIDSPPTIYRGRVLFGSADGYVYCLRATDGALVWRFRAAPVDQRVMAFEQLESVWPVHGSVLIQDHVLYCVAGRSMFLDGGLRLLKLNPVTGEKLSERVLDERDPETGANLQERVKILNMPVALPDILSSDGNWIYMRSQQFDFDGNRLNLGPHSGDRVEQASVQKGATAHLFSPAGFLDDTWFHRSFWLYGRSFAGGAGGWFQAAKFAPEGRILVFDDSTVYGYGRTPVYYRRRTPQAYHMFAADKQADIVTDPPVPDEGRKAVRPWDPQHTAYRWSGAVDIHARAMVLAGDVLFMAGPPDVADEEAIYDRMEQYGLLPFAELEKQRAALAGQQGAALYAVSAEDGRILSEYDLDTLPVFDGMIAVHGKLYISTMDGRVVCLEGRGE